MSFQSDMADDIDQILSWAEGSTDFEYTNNPLATEWSDGHGWISYNKSDFGLSKDAEGVSSDMVLSIPSTGSGAIPDIQEDKTLIKVDGNIYRVRSIDASGISGLNVLYCYNFSQVRRTGQEVKNRR